MKIEELFEMYKNLDIRERIRFDRICMIFNEEEKMKHNLKKKEILEEFNRVLNEERKPYFSSKFIENMLNLKH